MIIIGALGRCGKGAVEMAEKIGIPGLVVFYYYLAEFHETVHRSGLTRYMSMESIMVQKLDSVLCLCKDKTWTVVTYLF